MANNSLIPDQLNTFLEKNSGTNDLSLCVAEFTDLIYEYNVLRSLIQDHRENKELIELALKFAELLAKLHLNYLNIPREAAKFNRHQLEYKKLLSKSTVLPHIDTDSFFSQKIKNITRIHNPLRLTIVRFRRLLLVLSVLVDQDTLYGKFADILDYYTTPFFNNLSCFWFCPRLLLDLFLLAKHTIPCSLWMKDEERNLLFSVRFNTQLSYRSRSLANDFPWVIASFVLVFVLTGTLAAYLSLAMQFYDLIVFGLIIPYFEHRRFERILSKYKENESFSQSLKERMQFDEEIFSLGLKNFCSSSLATFLMLPACAAFSPVLPITGALIIFAVTVFVWREQEKINQRRDKKYDITFYSDQELQCADQEIKHDIPSLQATNN